MASIVYETEISGADLIWYTLSKPGQMYAVCKKIQCKTAYRRLDTRLSPDGNHEAAQAVNSVSMKIASDPNDMMISAKAYWLFTIVSSTGLREMSPWTVVEHVDRGQNSNTRCWTND